MAQVTNIIGSILDSTDTSKRFSVDFSGASTGTTLTLVSTATAPNETITFPTGNNTLVSTSAVQTLTNKTLTAPVISTIVNTGTLTLPTSTDTLVGRNTTDTLTNKTLTAPVISTIVNTGTLTLPTSTDTLVGRNTTDTLTNKTLTSATLTTPVISSIVNTGTLTLPTSTDTLVGRNTTDTLTNKTLTAPVISSITNGGTLTLPTGPDTLVGRSTTDTLTNKTLTAPVISSIVNTGTLTLPTSTDTLVGRNTTDTLTNKTLTAPVISTIVNTGTLTLPTSTDTLVGRNTTDTLTNKTLTSATLTTPVISTIVNTGTLTLPTSTDTLVGRNTTDTLTNKTITDSTNVVSASRLRSAGSDIIVSGAAQPTIVGQVLTINSIAGPITAEWTLPSGTGISTLNTLTTTTQFFATGTSGTDFNISSSTQTHTFNIPDASSTARGLVNNTSQTICGEKVFTTNGVASSTPVVISSALGQSVDILQIKNSVGTILSSYDSNGYLLLANQTGSTVPSAPSTGIKIFSQERAGRSMTSQVGPRGGYYSLQPGLFNNRCAIFLPSTGTTITLLGFGNTATGTATARTVTATNLLTSCRRVGYVSAATAGSTSGTRNGTAQFFMSNAPNLGGFFYVVRFGIATTVATQRSFVGLLSAITAIGNVNPSTLTNIIGFGVDTGDTSWSFMHNDGAGTATKDPLTGTFPARDGVSLFEARIYAPPNSATVYYSLEVLGGGSLFEGSTSTDLPAINTILAPQIWTNNETTASAVGIDIIFQYMETEY